MWRVYSYLAWCMGAIDGFASVLRFLLAINSYTTVLLDFGAREHLSVDIESALATTDASHVVPTFLGRKSYS